MSHLYHILLQTSCVKVAELPVWLPPGCSSYPCVCVCVRRPGAVFGFMQDNLGSSPFARRHPIQISVEASAASSSRLWRRISGAVRRARQGNTVFHPPPPLPDTEKRPRGGKKRGVYASRSFPRVLPTSPGRCADLLGRPFAADQENRKS